MASAAIVSTVHGQFADREREPHETVGALRAGLDHVRHTPALRAIVLAEFVAFLGVGIVIVSDAPLADHFDAGSDRLRPAGGRLGPGHDRRRLVTWSASAERRAEALLIARSCRAAAWRSARSSLFRPSSLLVAAGFGTA